MRLWRLSTAKYADNAFSGKGSALAGSRWSPVGRPVVYVSQSISLAVLEVLVHADPMVLPRHIVLPIDVPASLPIATIGSDELDENWRATPAPGALSAVGKRWLDAADSAILKVPSAIIPQESNFLINPLHPDFARCRIGAPESFGIDGRLWPVH